MSEEDSRVNLIWRKFVKLPVLILHQQAAQGYLSCR